MGFPLNETKLLLKDLTTDQIYDYDSILNDQSVDLVDGKEFLLIHHSNSRLCRVNGKCDEMKNSNDIVRVRNKMIYFSSRNDREVKIHGKRTNINLLEEVNQNGSNLYSLIFALFNYFLLNFIK